MTLNSGITINGKHSYNDFDLYVSEKVINLPTKEVITDTVPFMNGYYDFSNMLGNIVFKERTIDYTFDLMSTSTKSLEEIKTDIAMWLMNAHNVDIYDDELNDYHFKGSFNTCNWSEDDEYGELEVSFLCQPFKIANEETYVVLENGDNDISYAGMPTMIYAVATATTTISINSVIFTISTAKAPLSMPLTGDLTVNYTEDETVTLSYRKEVI